MSTERLWGVSARLLATASVLSTVGLGLAIRLAWRQAVQSFGPDGTPNDHAMPLAPRLVFVMLNLSYRDVGLQLVVSSALVGAAVVALHRNPSWARVRLLRWEVLGAWIVTLVAIAGLVLANLYLMTAPEAADRAMEFMGPQPLTELTLGNLTTLVASLSTLTVAALWWLRLAPDPDGSDDGPDEPGEELGDGVEGPTEQLPAASSTNSVAKADVQPAKDYSRDWSPEDFRRPRQPD